MPTQWSGAEQVPLGCIAPPRPHCVSGGQSRPPLQPSTERPPCFFSVIPRAQSARGNPYPAPAGAESPCLPLRGIVIDGRTEPRPYTRSTDGLCVSLRADVGIRPYTRFPGGKTFSTSGQRPPPTFAASRQRRDLIIAPSPGWGFQRGGVVQAESRRKGR